MWLGDNAAGWSWSVDATPGEDGEFTRPGSQDERHRIDLLTALGYDLGHMLGHKHTESGVMAETLVAGTRRMSPSGSDLVDVVVLDRVFADGRRRLAVPSLRPGSPGPRGVAEAAGSGKGEVATSALSAKPLGSSGSAGCLTE
jgi:hypothetical protein